MVGSLRKRFGIPLSEVSISILDQFFVYHPEPWEDRDWKAASGLPLEDVWFQAADGMKLFGWYVESRAEIGRAHV